MALIYKIFLPLILSLVAGTAWAGPVTLKANPVDTDGRVTLGDLFDGAGAASAVVVGTRVGPSIVFEAGHLQTQALRAGLQWDNPRGLSRVVVRAADMAPASVAASAATAGPAARLTVSANTATTEILTYARSLASGDIVQPEDVIWTTVQAHQAVGGTPTDADRVIGLVARRALRSGAAVSTRDLSAPQIIARNDMVEVAFISGGVKLTVTGRATRNAAAGDALQILNLQSGRTIDAVAVAPGRAVAGPAAQAARTDPTAFSAR